MMKYGSTLLPERFWAKVAIGPNGIHFKTGANLGPCWLWTAGQLGKGYGHFSVGSGPGRDRYSHRVAYEAANGPVQLPQLDHLCRVRLCCNPKHLEPGTPGENIARGDRLKLKLVCKRGHAFTPENTRFYTWPNGLKARFCRECKRERYRVLSKR